MAKKERDKRRGMTPEDVQAHLDKIPTKEGRVEYLGKLLDRRKILSDNTKASVYKVIDKTDLRIHADYYVRQGDKSLEEGEKIFYWLGAAEVYEDVGERDKASKMYQRVAEGLKSQGDTRGWRKFNDLSQKALKGDSGWNKERHEHIFGRAAATASITGIIGGIFFLSSNITGNAIGSSAISHWIGAVLLVVGLVAGFFWLKSKK
jgi:hypothetical protein